MSIIEEQYAKLLNKNREDVKMRNLSEDKERELKAHFKELADLSIEELIVMGAEGSRFKDIITSMGKIYHCEFTIKEIE